MKTEARYVVPLTHGSAGSPPAEIHIFDGGAPYVAIWTEGPERLLGTIEGRRNLRTLAHAILRALESPRRRARSERSAKR